MDRYEPFSAGNLPSPLGFFAFALLFFPRITADNHFDEMAIPGTRYDSLEPPFVEGLSRETRFHQGFPV